MIEKRVIFEKPKKIVFEKLTVKEEEKVRGGDPPYGTHCNDSEIIRPAAVNCV